MCSHNKIAGKVNKMTQKVREEIDEEGEIDEMEEIQDNAKGIENEALKTDKMKYIILINPM